MLQDAELYSQHCRMQVKQAQALFDCVLPEMSFGEEDIVMDIGCGPGDCTRDVLLPPIPKLKKIVAIDVMPQMIEFAKTHTADEKIEYHVADIENKSSLKLWEGLISKAFSIYCFQWLKNQRKAFQCLHDLLKPKGEAALAFVIASPLWDCYPSLIKDLKWNKYLKNADQFVPESHLLHHGAEHYRNTLEDVGFDVLTCLDEKRIYTYENDAEFKAMFKSCSALASYIPDHLREEFMDDFFRMAMKFNGRNSEGLPMLLFTNLEIHVRKP